MKVYWWMTERLFGVERTATMHTGHLDEKMSMVRQHGHANNGKTTRSRQQTHQHLDKGHTVLPSEIPLVESSGMESALTNVNFTLVESRGRNPERRRGGGMCQWTAVDGPLPNTKASRSSVPGEFEGHFRDCAHARRVKPTLVPFVSSRMWFRTSYISVLWFVRRRPPSKRDEFLWIPNRVRSVNMASAFGRRPW